MIQYLIQVVAFQLLFLVAYDLFLKKETFFQWNRMYLIFSSLIAFLLPFIKIQSFQNAVPQEYIVLLPEIVLTPEKTVASIAPSWNWYLIIGIMVSSFLFIYKIVQLLRLKFKGIIVHKGNHNIIKIPNSTIAFSIFNYVFIGNNISEEKLEDILSHELVHVREKHSLDLLYFELLRILCWFNPLVYIYQKRISEVHEYIADASVAKENNKSDYYEKLLAEVFQTQHFSFTNQFFKHSLIKKRIIMLTKQKSRQILKLKYLVLVPMIIGTLFYTSCEATKFSYTEDSTIENVVNATTQEELQDVKETSNDTNDASYEEALSSEKSYVKEETSLYETEKVEAAVESVVTVQNQETLANQQSEVQESEVEREVSEKIETFLGDQGPTFESEATNATSNEETIVEIENSYKPEQEKVVEFKKVDKSPVYPGCESASTLEEIRQCLVQSVQKHVNKNFNTKIADELKLVGLNKILAKFVIDTNGNVVNINVEAPHPALADETERVLNAIPKLVKPAMKDGKAVSVQYMLPIVFQISE